MKVRGYTSNLSVAHSSTVNSVVFIFKTKISPAPQDRIWVLLRSKFI